MQKGGSMVDQVNILGVTYKIKEVSTVDKYDPKLGMINYIDSEILIDENLTEEKKKAVLMHEILHGICEALGIEQLNENEQNIQSLAQALYCTLKGQAIFS